MLVREDLIGLLLDVLLGAQHPPAQPGDPGRGMTLYAAPVMPPLTPVKCIALLLTA
jgi:hypothetical protein